MCHWYPRVDRDVSCDVCLDNRVPRVMPVISGKLAGASPATVEGLPYNLAVLAGELLGVFC